MGWSDWVTDGALRTRFRMQPTGSKRNHELVRELNQPDRDLILTNVKKARDEVETGATIKDLSFGRYLGTIPTIDLLKLQETHPDLFSPDGEIARKATIRFFNSSEGAKFRVQRA